MEVVDASPTLLLSGGGGTGGETPRGGPPAAYAREGGTPHAGNLHAKSVQFKRIIHFVSKCCAAGKASNLKFQPNSFSRTAILYFSVRRSVAGCRGCARRGDLANFPFWTWSRRRRRRNERRRKKREGKGCQRQGRGQRGQGGRQGQGGGRGHVGQGIGAAELDARGGRSRQGEGPPRRGSRSKQTRPRTSR